MATKQPRLSRSAGSSEVDDLKRIDGIGPAVESRLNGVGIFTFAQLAILAPADIAAAVAGLAGFSAERIIKQDWIGQARAFALSSARTSALEERDVAIVADVQILTESISQKPEIELLRVSRPRLVVRDTPPPYTLLRSDQPYEVHFNIHFAEELLSPTSALMYAASVYGRHVFQNGQYPIGIERGTIDSTAETTVIVKGTSLPQGVYWLEAETTILLPSTPDEDTPSQKLLATAKGRPFEIT